MSAKFIKFSVSSLFAMDETILQLQRVVFIAGIPTSWANTQSLSSTAVRKKRSSLFPLFSFGFEWISDCIIKSEVFFVPCNVFNKTIFNVVHSSFYWLVSIVQLLNLNDTNTSHTECGIFQFFSLPFSISILWLLNRLRIQKDLQFQRESFLNRLAFLPSLHHNVKVSANHIFRKLFE